MAEHYEGYGYYIREKKIAEKNYGLKINVDNMKYLSMFGKPKFDQFWRDEKNRTHQVHMYVTLGNKCMNRCSFCRNGHVIGQSSKPDFEKIEANLKSISPYVRNLTLGGGEPLLYDEILNEMDPKAFASRKLYMVTSGPRDLFLERFEGMTNGKIGNRSPDYWSDPSGLLYDGIYLSRHQIDDHANAAVFGNSDLLRKADLRELPGFVRSKIVLFATCFKNGGLETPGQIVNYVANLRTCGLSKVTFNNLHLQSTDSEYYLKHQVDDDLFDKARAKLAKRFTLRSEEEFIYSGGCKITICNYQTKHGGVSVGFKQYFTSTKDLKNAWLDAKRRTFDLSMMPDGQVYCDLVGKQRIKRL